MPSRSVRAVSIPRLIWFATEAPPVGAGCWQLQLRTPNELGSALAGADSPTAAAPAIAALATSFVTKRDSPISTLQES
jgi:hypothetical protein